MLLSSVPYASRIQTSHAHRSILNTMHDLVRMASMHMQHIAAQEGHGDTIRVLLAHRADVQAKTSNGNTALHVVRARPSPCS